MKTPFRPRRLGPLLIFALLAFSTPVRAGDVTAFVAFAAPTDTWGHGYGGAISSSWLGVLSLEGELARMSTEAPGVHMTSLTGSVLLAPPLPLFTLYGGLGIGVFRHNLGDGDTGVLRCLVFGVKLKAALLVVKGEYRRIELGDDALLPMDHRVSLGAGISF